MPHFSPDTGETFHKVCVTLEFEDGTKHGLLTDISKTYEIEELARLVHNTIAAKLIQPRILPRITIEEVTP